MGKRRNWVKLYEGWYSTPSHATLSFYALGIGPILMIIADADPSWKESGSARVLTPKGSPMPLETIAKLSRLRPKRALAAIQELIEVGTLVRTAEGALMFPNYQQYQEHRTTRGKREGQDKVRNSRETLEKVTGDSRETLGGFSGKERKRKRKSGDVEEDLTPLPLKGLGAAHPAKSKPRGKSKFTDDERAQAGEVIEALNAARKSLSKTARGYTASDENIKHIVGRLRSGVELPELLGVVEARAASTDVSANQLRWLSHKTPFLAGNWDMSLEILDEFKHGNERKRAQGVTITKSGYAQVNGSGSKLKGSGTIDMPHFMATGEERFLPCTSQSEDKN